MSGIVAVVKQTLGRVGEAAVNDIGKLQYGSLIGGKGIVGVKLVGIGGVERGDGEETVLGCNVGVDVVPI
jgi:hypothetical protein